MTHRLEGDGSPLERLERLMKFLEKHGEQEAQAVLRHLVPKPHPAESIPTSRFLEDCKSGDLILWSGSIGISLLVRFVTWSPFSHASLVLRGPLDETEEGTPAASKPRLFQSTWSYFPEAVDGDHKRVGEHVMLNDLDVVLRDNLAEKEPPISRALAFPADAAPVLESNLVAYIHKTLGAPFPGARRGEPNAIDFFRGMLHLSKKLPGTYFCSELVAGAYQAMGVLSRAWEDNAYKPSDFSRAKDHELGRFLEPGFSLGPEIGLTGEG